MEPVSPPALNPLHENLTDNTKTDLLPISLSSSPAGHVSAWLAAAIGVLTGICCALLEDINHWIRIDEGLDVFKLHGCGGMMGSFLTGIFATSTVSALDGALVAEGGVDGNGIQIARQIADIASVAAYSFALRVSEEAEMQGLDHTQFFEEDVGDWSQGYLGFGKTTAHVDGKGVFVGKDVSGVNMPPSEVDDLVQKKEPSD